MKRNKILLTGFPHSGTSILKSKMGECKNLYEIPFEDFFVKPEDIHWAGDKEFKLVKTPIMPVDLRANGLPYSRLPESRYYDYIILFIIRNPWNLFTSIIKTGNDPLNTFEVNQSNKYFIRVTEYLVLAKMFLEILEKNYQDIYAIKYEDFFPNNYQSLKELFDKIGLDYDDDIFLKRSKNYIHFRGINYESINPDDLSYEKSGPELRTWQINQEFKNMNGEVNIPEELNKILTESEIVKKLGYSDPRISH